MTRENCVSAASVPGSNTCAQYVPASADVTIWGASPGVVITDSARLQGAPDAGTPMPTPAGSEPLPNVASVTFTVPPVVSVNARDALPRTATSLAKVTVTGDVLVVEGDVVVPLPLHAAETAARSAIDANQL